MVSLVPRARSPLGRILAFVTFIIPPTLPPPKIGKIAVLFY